MQRPMSQSRVDAEGFFLRALASSGAKRGVFHAKSDDSASGEIRIYDVIGSDFWTGEGVTAQAVADALDAVKGAKSLEIRINSPGGDLYEGKAIFNLLRTFPASVKTVHVDGIAASAASLIAMAGTKIVTGPGSTWLVHRVSSGAWGNEDVLAQAARDVAAETTAIIAIYEQRTGSAAADIRALMVEDRIMGAIEAKRLGFTDEISEADQRRMDEEDAQRANAHARTSSVSPQTVAALARAKAASLREQFSGASPGTKHPGQPGNKAAGPAKAGKDG